MNHLKRRRVSVSIIGFGTEGRHIAAELLRRGYFVNIYDINPCHVHSALTSVNAILHPKRGMFRMLNMYKLSRRIRVEHSLEALLSIDSDLVLEAIDENLQAKRELFRRVSDVMKRRGILPKDVVLATNTLSLPIHELAIHMEEPYRSRCIGLRFVGPEFHRGEVVLQDQNCIAESLLRRLGLQDIGPTKVRRSSVLKHTKHIGALTLARHTL